MNRLRVRLLNWLNCCRKLANVVEQFNTMFTVNKTFMSKTETFIFKSETETFLQN
jgi:hypothetical protein